MKFLISLKVGAVLIFQFNQKYFFDCKKRQGYSTIKKLCLYKLKIDIVFLYI